MPTRKTLPVLMFALLMMFGVHFSIQAACSGTPPSPIICDNANDTVTVSGSETIIVGEDNAIFGGQGDNSITNDGLLSTSLGSSGFADIDVRSGNDTVTNNGTVQGLIYAGTGNDSVTNTGSIRDGIVGAAGNDLISNSGTIRGVVPPAGGIFDGGIVNGDGGGPSFSGNDTIVNSGLIAGGGDTLHTVNLGPGNDSIVNTGTINAADGNAIFSPSGNNYVQNDGLIENPADTLSGFADIDVRAGNDTVVNNGTLLGLIFTGDANDSIVNTGFVRDNIDAEDNDDRISNSGTVGGDVLGGSGNDTIINTNLVQGTINGGPGADSIVGGSLGDRVVSQHTGADTIITNAGNDTVTITAAGQAWLINLGGGADSVSVAGLVNNSLLGGVGNDTITITGSGSVAIVNGEADNDSITNNGLISTRVRGGTGSDTIINNGTIGIVQLDGGADSLSNAATAIITGGIDCGAGNDTLQLGGTISGGITCGSGNDRVFILQGGSSTQGASISGTIDGGSGTLDTLTFQFTVTASELTAFNAIFPTLFASGGTVTVAGVTYSWINFEGLVNLVSLASEPFTVTVTINRRANFNDVAAPVAIFCEAGGIDLWAVDAHGVGSFAFSVPYEEVNAGTSVIAMGVTFISYPGGSFSVSATAHDGKPYFFAGSCG